MKAPELKYRVVAVDEHDAIVAEQPTDIVALDGVLLFQLRQGYYPSREERERTLAQLKEAFPGRKVLLLSGDIAFVKLVPSE